MRRIMFALCIAAIMGCAFMSIRRGLFLRLVSNCDVIRGGVYPLLCG